MLQCVAGCRSGCTPLPIQNVCVRMLSSTLTQRATRHVFNDTAPEEVFFGPSKLTQCATLHGNSMGEEEKRVSGMLETTARDYGVATISRLLKIVGLFCKRTL